MAGCQTLPKGPKATDTGEAVWQMTIRVQDLKKNQSHYLRGEAISQKQPAQLRLDLRATTMGVYVGSMLAQDGTTKLLLARQRKFYEGESGPEFLWRLTKVPLDARDLQKLIWGEELPEAQWECEIIHGVEQRVCRHRQFELKVTQTGLDLQSRKFHFEARAAVVDVNLSLAQTKVERAEEIFTLTAPQGFSVQKLN